jgi:hypothetical protein
MSDDDDLTAFHEHLDDLEAEHGVALDDDDRRALWDQSHAHCFSVAATEAAFSALIEGDEEDEDDYEEPFDDDSPDLAQVGAELSQRDMEIAVREAGAKLGRKLTGAETERVSELVQAQTPFGDRIRPEHVSAAFEAASVKPWSEMSREDQNATMAARIREAEGRDPNSGLQLRDSYDLSDRDQRNEYDALRMSGTEFEDAEA